MRLLDALPGAVLWLLQWNANVEATLTAAARARGIAPGRIVFAPLLATRDHLSRLASADLFLDAWPCNAHTTVGEALWVGLPVVTVIGPTFAQRVAASLLHAVGLDELVVRRCPGMLDRWSRWRTIRRAARRWARAWSRHATPARSSTARASPRDIEALFRACGHAPSPGSRPSTWPRCRRRRRAAAQLPRFRAR